MRWKQVRISSDRDIQPDTLAHSSYALIEQFLAAKSGREEDCEDAIYAGPNFVAVIDGATSKSERRWDGKTGGRIAAEIIKEAFEHVPADATARKTVDILTAAIHALYVQHDAVDLMSTWPVQRAVASFVAINLARRELWFVGDCQCLLDHELLTNTKRIDDITADARSLFLETELLQGKTIEELRQHDSGRAFILPLLERQTLLQNTPAAGPYWFPVIDGYPVPDTGIRVQSLPEHMESVVLASDGYPYLKNSLEASEQALQEVIAEDPLLFRSYKSTKGLSEGNISYDDRAYIRIKMPARS